MAKKYAIFTCRVTLFLFCLIYLQQNTAFSSINLLDGGRVVSASPFDSKARGAGCFDIALPEQPARLDTQSIEGLFFTAKSFRYSSDRGGDRWQSADETQQRRSGDCEDKAIWLFTRLLESGAADVRLVIGRYRSIDSNLHVWVVCSDSDGNVRLLDPAIQKRVWILTAVDSGLYQPLYAYDGRSCYRYF
ncbi:MAG: transglutaminase domain-containing protein [Candidatus Omnitrophota bacterium]